MRKLINSKAAKMGLVEIIIVIVLVYAVYSLASAPGGFLASSGGAPASGGSSVTSNVAPAANTVQVVGAPCTLSTTLTSSVVRRYTEVAQGSENVTIVQNGVLKGTVAHGSTTTVQSGPNADTLDLYPALQSTTFYATHLKGKLATCTGAATTGDSQLALVTNDENAVGGTSLLPTDTPNHVYQIDTNGNSNWFSIVNDGQANQNTGGQGQSTGANLTIGTGGTGSVTITFRPGYNTALGPVGGNVLACQFPSAVYDSVAPLIVSYNGVKLSETSTKPSSTNYPLTGTNYTVRAFVMPGIDGRTTPTNIMSVIVRADSNHNPAGSIDRINCTIFDTNYYQRQRDGKYVLDIENRDTNVDVGATTDPSFEIGVA